MPTITVRGINLYYELHGSGEPLLLIQGLGLDCANWVYQIPVLSQRYQVIVFDNRGIGRTDVPEGNYTTDEMAAEAIALLDHLEIPQTHVLGFSMGGFIAQVLAFRYPERVKQLVLVSTAAKLPAVTQQILQSWLRMLQEKVRPETRIRSQLPWLFTNRFFENSQQVDELIRLSLQYPYPPTVAGFAGQVAACVAHDIQQQLHQIIAPTLVLVGAEERLIPLERSQFLAERLPNAELKIVQEAGHNFFWERPELLNQAILQFTH
jgi:3-oxoadipate enol-lactonase